MGITEELVGGDPSFSEDIDSGYEFDASHYYDFYKEETESEAEEAENWFRYASEYPPSPFILKMKLMKAAKSIPRKPYKSRSLKKEAISTSSNSDCDNDYKATSREVKGEKHQSQIPQDKMKTKSKSSVNLSFMKPTASHLAKQNRRSDIHSGGGCGRLQKPLVIAGEKLRSPIRSRNQTTKRQKLEFGYLSKATKYERSSNFRVKRLKASIPKKNCIGNTRENSKVPE
ncbi:uncharacterized protein LOC143585586 [Bidens hawaiensis]|uniref:uncharacterized protein LOC143585586 n=1 Tax=Bidens hawaiensis TaxID=980011 RepID=UPI004049DC8D